MPEIARGGITGQGGDFGAKDVQTLNINAGPGIGKFEQCY